MLWGFLLAWLLARGGAWPVSQLWPLPHPCVSLDARVCSCVPPTQHWVGAILGKHPRYRSLLQWETLLPSGAQPWVGSPLPSGSTELTCG